MYAVPFMASFIASPFALRLQLPQGAISATNIQEWIALILTIRVCLSLIKNALGQKITNLDQTLMPIIDRAHIKKATT